MTTMLAEIYDALKEAGASEEKARSAAEAVATYERDSDGLRRRLNTVVEFQEKMQRDIAKLQTDYADMKSDIKVVKWMLGAIFAGQAAIILRLFLH